MSQLAHQRTDALKADLIFGFTIVHGPSNLGMHGGAAQLFRRIFRPNRGLHQRRPGQKKSAAFGHQDGVTHDWKISASRHAHAHNRGDLRDSFGGHHGIVAKDAPKIIGVRKDIFLERQEDPCGIHQVNRGDMVFNGNILGADDLLGGHRKECPGFHRGIIHNQHEQAAMNVSQAGDHSC